MSSNYYNKCGSCSHLNPRDRDGYRYHCDYQRAYYPLDDKVCGHYDYDKYRDYEELFKNDNPSGCYITTLMCEILKLPDDYPILNTLRKFRDNVLQKNSKYYMTLLEYDTIGPVIASSLKNDKEALTLARSILTKYIWPMITYIETGNNDLAVLLYSKMVNNLKDAYGLNNYDKQVENYNYSLGGHGTLKLEKTR